VLHAILPTALSCVQAAEQWGGFRVLDDVQHLVDYLGCKVMAMLQAVFRMEIV